MIRIVIVDDDERMRAVIWNKIKEISDTFRETEIQLFESGESFLEQAKEKDYGDEGDIFIVDIDLGDGMTGLELGRVLRKKYPNRGLIFLTSHGEFALESYEIEADQYILKTQMDERLPRILEKLMYRMGAEKVQYLMLKKNEHSEAAKVYFREMIYIHKKKMGKYAEYFTFQGQFLERNSLSSILEKLDSKEFFLVDRSNIINLRNVRGIQGNLIYMEEGYVLELNQYRIKAAKQKIEEYWRVRRWNENSMS